MNNVEITKFAHETVSGIAFYPYVVFQGNLSDFWSAYAAIYYKNQGKKDGESTQGSSIRRLLEF